MLDLALDRKWAARIRVGAPYKYVKCRGKHSGDKAQLVAAVMAHNPDAPLLEIAEKAGVSERYLRQIRNEK
jgi:hypothetical protein